MTDKLKNIFDESACPDRETLFAYAEDKLSPAARHKMEVHLLDCTFCSEALEALRDRNDLPEINDRLAEMEKRILAGDTTRRGGATGNWRQYLKLAAIITLLFASLGTLYILLKDNNNKNVVVEAPVSVKAPTVEKQEPYSGQAPKPAKALIKKSEASAANELESNRENLDEAPALMSADAAEPESERDNKSLAASKTVTDQVYSPLKKAAATDRAKTQKSEMKEVVKDTQFSRVTEESQSVKSPASSAASEDLSLETVVSTRQTTQLLDSAIRAFDGGYYIKTINMLSSFTGNNQKEKDKAQWYLANAYVKTMEYEKARPILQNLHDNGSSFSRKARKLLEKIQ